MTPTLALAIGMPALLAAAWLALPPGRLPTFADSRGIALQTVIVIVVMLVIAGAVSIVLLTRGGEVVTALEQEDVNSSVISSEAECDDASRALLKNTTVDGQWTQAGFKCVITSGHLNQDFSSFFCRRYSNAEGDIGVYDVHNSRSRCTIG